MFHDYIDGLVQDCSISSALAVLYQAIDILYIICPWFLKFAFFFPEKMTSTAVTPVKYDYNLADISYTFAK